MSPRQQGKRFRGNVGGILAALAAVAVIGGGVYEVTKPPSGGGGGGGVPTRFPNVTSGYVTNANVWVTPGGGNDSTCTYHAPAVAYSSGLGCATVSNAINLSQGTANNGVIGFVPGLYQSSQFPGGYAVYGTTGSSNAVTLSCQTGATTDSVDFNTGTTVWYGVKNLTVRGSCFHIRQPQLGLAGSPADPPCSPTNANLQTGPIMLDGIHVDSFDIIRTCNATLQNSQIGPFIACWQPGTTGGIGECQSTGPLSSVEKWYADQNTGTCTTVIAQTEPYIRNDPWNTTLYNNLFTGLNTADPNTPTACSGTGIHAGGLLIWTATNLTIDSNEWRNVFLYCIEFNDTSVETNYLYQNNICGHTVNSNEAYPSTLYPARINHAGGANCQEGAGGYYFGAGNSKNIFVTNSTWRYNTYADCFQTAADPSNSLNTNVQVIGNLIGGVSGGGAVNCLTVSGISYDYNTVGNGDASCGSHPGTVAGSPFTNAAAEPQDLKPISATPPLNYVPCGSGTAHLTYDILGATRPAAANCTVGAYENH